MTTINLIKEYGKEIDPEILTSYQQAEKHIIVNDNDIDLVPIKIKLPSPPKYHKIAGFGLPAKEQKFAASIQKLPKKLKELQKRCETIAEIWDILQSNQIYYKKEIRFIKKAWYHRLNGYWFFNNGVPTYIDGWHYFYCTWYNIDVGLPKYRSRDRKFFLFARFCYTDTTAVYNYRTHYKRKPYYFATIDQTREFCTQRDIEDPKIDEGFYFINTGRRTCFGFTYPKHRREGATYKAECINYEIISRTMNANGGIQSMNEKSAKKAYLKALISPWKKLPFFFKPQYEGSTDPKAALTFNPPAIRISSKGSLASSNLGLESVINYEDADVGAYDGDKLHVKHDDEIGKSTKVNIYERYNVAKECLSTGAGSEIHGLYIGTSTVGEMSTGGGRNFLHLCKLSHYEIRNQNGQTVSGSYNLFISAEEGLEGFIDEFGNSVIEDPEEPVRGEDGKMITKGSRSYIKDLRSGFIAAEDYEGLSEKIRQYPTSFRECFRSSSKDSGFNVIKLDQRLDELKFRNPHKVRGDFYRVDGKKDGRVEFRPNPENGKFWLSKKLPQNESSRRIYDHELNSWKPLNSTKFVAGGDPFAFNKTEGHRKSNGGGAVYYRYDASAEEKPDEVKVSRRFVCTYSNRVFSKDLYAEDMLMMCIYFGCKMNAEINNPILWDHFEARGYSGYLFYQIDRKTERFKNTPGTRVGNNDVKQDIFTEYMNYIEENCHREVHDELLYECREIEGPDEMTKFDLFAAGGHALVAAKEVYEEIERVEDNDDVVDLSRYIASRNY
jgi:hypothetical protein